MPLNPARRAVDTPFVTNWWRERVRWLAVGIAVVALTGGTGVGISVWARPSSGQAVLAEHDVSYEADRAAAEANRAATGAPVSPAVPAITAPVSNATATTRATTTTAAPSSPAVTTTLPPSVPDTSIPPPTTVPWQPLNPGDWTFQDGDIHARLRVTPATPRLSDQIQFVLETWTSQADTMCCNVELYYADQLFRRWQALGPCPPQPPREDRFTYPNTESPGLLTPMPSFSVGIRLRVGLSFNPCGGPSAMIGTVAEFWVPFNVLPGRV